MMVICIKQHATFEAEFMKELRLLTGKECRQIKLQRFQKVRISAFGLLVY